MEHKELESARKLMESYGHTTATVFNRVECYIDGMPCQCWIDDAGYHFSTGDEEHVESTWKRISSIIVKYIMGEYHIMGSRELHAYILAHESGFGMFYDAFRDMEASRKKDFTARILDSGTVYATIDIGESSLLSCFFSKKNWTVEIYMGDSSRRMRFDWNSVNDFIQEVKCVVADYFLNR